MYTFLFFYCLSVIMSFIFSLSKHLFLHPPPHSSLIPSSSNVSAVIPTESTENLKGSESVWTLLACSAGEGRDFSSLIAFEVLKTTRETLLYDQRKKTAKKKIKQYALDTLLLGLDVP